MPHYIPVRTESHSPIVSCSPGKLYFNVNIQHWHVIEKTRSRGHTESNLYTYPYHLRFDAGTSDSLMQLPDMDQSIRPDVCYRR